MLAARRCHALAAIVGEPSIVSALGAARRGASVAPTAKPMTTAISPSTADSSANTAVTWRGVRPTAFSSPISRCCSLVRAPTRIATTENTTKSSTIVYVVRVIRIGSASRSASARCRCHVRTSKGVPGVTDAAARSAKAGAVEGSLSRMACVQFQRSRSGTIRASVARATQPTPGFERG